MSSFVFRLSLIVLAFIIKIFNFIVEPETELIGYLFNALSVILLVLAFINHNSKTHSVHADA